MKKIRYIILLFMCSTVNNLVISQPLAGKLYDMKSWITSYFYVPDDSNLYLDDGYIERTNESYLYFVPTMTNPDKDIIWTATGGTVIKSFDTIEGAYRQVIVKWDVDASNYALRACQYDSYGNTTLDKTFNFKKDYTFKMSANTIPVCADKKVSYTFDFSFPDDLVPTKINLYVRIFITGPGISATAIKTFFNSGKKSISGSGSFVPEDYGIYGSLDDIGTYQLWVSVSNSGQFCPNISKSLDITKPAPKIEKNNTEITELVVSKNGTTITKESTFSINQFTYEGTVYSRGGAFPTKNSQPVPLGFSVNYKNNDGIGTTAPFPNAIATSWAGMTRYSEDLNFFTNGGIYTSCELILNENGTGDGCTAFPSFDIPQAIISHTKPDCTTNTKGSITINNAKGETYKLFECSFNKISDTIMINREGTPIKSASLSGSNKVLSSDLESGEYIVRIEKAPFIIEEYFDLRAPSLNLSATGVQSTCNAGDDGEIEIASYTYDENNYSSYDATLPEFTFNLYNSSSSDAIAIDNITLEDGLTFPLTFEGITTNVTGLTTMYTTVSTATCESDKLEVTIAPTINNDVNIGTIDTTNINSCSFPDGAFIVTASGGNSTAFNYQLFQIGNPSPLNSNGTGIFEGISYGNYYIKASDVCETTDSTEIYYFPQTTLPVIEMSDLELPKPLCHNGDTIYTITNFSYGGNNATELDPDQFSMSIIGDGRTINENTVSLPYVVEDVTGGDNWSITIEKISSGCSQTFYFDIPNQDVIEITKDSIPAQCNNEGNVTLIASVTGGVEPYTYTWNDLINDTTFSETTSSIEVWEGTYQLGVVDANNCGYKKTVADGIPSLVTFKAIRPTELTLTTENVTIADAPDASTGSVTLESTGGGQFHTYAKNGGQFQDAPYFGGLTSGNYTFTVKDEKGCETTINTFVGEAETFNTSIKSVTNVNCFDGNDGQIAITANGGVKPYIFEINGPSGIITQQDSVFTNLQPGTYLVKVYYSTYKYSLPDQTITKPSQLTASITDFTNAVCNQAIGSATVTASGGTPGYTYQWTGAGNNQTTQTASELRAGIHSVTVTDANECTAETSIQLFDPAGPVLEQIGSTPALCSDSENGGSATLEVTGGTPDYSIEWEDIDVTGLVAENIAPGLYTAIVTDATGCSYTLENIEVPAPDELSAIIADFKDPACYNDTNGEITIAGNGGTAPYHYQWQNIDGNPTTATVTGLAAGTYEVLITDEHNCTATASNTLMNPEEIIINLPDSVFICQGQTATLDAGNLGALFEWVADNGFSSNQQIINVQDQGAYLLQVSNVEGCSNTAKTYVKFENRQFYGTFLMSGEATMTDTVIVIELSKPQPDSVQWYITDDFMRLVDGNDYKELIPLQTGDFVVGMKAYFAGCEETVEKRISIIPADNSTNQKAATDALIQKAKLFPNPNTGQFEVEVNLAKEADISADVFSMKGMRMIPTKYDYGKKDYILGFNLMQLNPGVYFVNIMVENEVRKLKFIVN
jgi:hypothetical protein